MSSHLVHIMLGPFISMTDIKGYSIAVSGAIVDFSGTDSWGAVLVGSTSGSGTTDNRGILEQDMTIDPEGSILFYRTTYPAGVFDSSRSSYQHQEFGSIPTFSGVNK